MSGKSILTSIFGSNNTNSNTLDYDDNTQSQQSSPSLLSPANSESLFNAETQQISNSSNQREHNFPFEQPISPPTLTQHEVIAATPTDNTEQVPSTPPIMPTGVKIQINHPTSPESVTDRVMTSSTATAEQPPQVYIPPRNSTNPSSTQNTPTRPPPQPPTRTNGHPTPPGLTNVINPHVSPDPYQSPQRQSNNTTQHNNPDSNATPMDCSNNGTDNNTTTNQSTPAPPATTEQPTTTMFNQLLQ
eukprot:scaffold79954_cov53-Cyclotella_meneghiniana.AAC.1